MKKRIVSLLMTALLTVSLFPTAALAEGEGTEPLPEIGFYTAQAGGEENRISGQYNYLEHYEGERVVWLVSESGFSDGDEPTVSLVWNFNYPTETGDQTCNDSIEIPEGWVEKVAQTGSDPVVYAYKFDLSCVKTALSSVLPQYNPETYLCRLTVQIGDQTATLEITIPHREPYGIPVGNNGYILSTYNHFEMDNTASPIYVSGSWAYAGMPDFEYVGVLKPKTIDGYTEYDVAPQDEIQWTANRVWIENIVGDGGTWSFHEDETVTELQNPTLPVGFYGTAPGCYSLLLYEVTVTYEGSSSTYVLGFNMDRLNDVPPPKLERGDDDTVEELNEALQSIESGSVVTLGNTTYRGVIEVPEGKIIDFQGGRKTIIEGGINAPGGVTASSIHFRGTEGVTQAVTGGFTSVGCSFTGYRVALGANQDGMRNVFIGNEVAILVDDSGWPEGSTFIQNGTAIKIENLGNFYRPYMFRIYECNFIDNGVDFDVSVPGTFYFNRNYFGRLKHQGQGSTGWGEWSNLQQAITQTSVNAVIGRQKAKIQAGEGTRVVADVVYKYPVLYWWIFEASIEEVFGSGEATPTAYSMEYEAQYINVLTADWDTAVQMADNDEESMVIEAEAFEVETEGAKEISVMNESGSAVGTWSFGGGAQ